MTRDDCFGAGVSADSGQNVFSTLAGALKSGNTDWLSGGRPFDLIVLGTGNIGSVVASHLYKNDHARTHRILAVDPGAISSVAGPKDEAEHSAIGFRGTVPLDELHSQSWPENVLVDLRQYLSVVADKPLPWPKHRPLSTRPENRIRNGFQTALGDRLLGAIGSRTLTIHLVDSETNPGEGKASH